MEEPPVPLFVPPEEVPRRLPEPLPQPLLPTAPGGDRLLVGIAGIDHSGRLREQRLVTALGWQAGDRFDTHAAPDMILLRPAPHGPYRVDARRQIFLPAGLRALFRIEIGDRVVLAAAPDANILIIHPLHVVADLLAKRYATLRTSVDD